MPITEITWSADEGGMFSSGPGGIGAISITDAAAGAGVLAISETAVVVGGTVITLTAGQFLTQVGFRDIALFGSFPIGSVNPSILNGVTIWGIIEQSADNTVNFYLEGHRAQSFFTSMTLNGTLFATNVATWSQGGPPNNTVWRWTGITGIVDTGVYPITFVLP